MKTKKQVDRGPYIRTASGLKFHPLDPRPEDIRIEDLAYQLANTPRWGGTVRPGRYSVARHSIWCAHVAKWQGLPRETARALLYHDASEAYICDVPKPIKGCIRGYKKIEDRIMRAVGDTFGFRWPLSPAAHAIDEMALVVERVILFGRDHLEEDYADLVHLWDTAGSLPLVLNPNRNCTVEEDVTSFLYWARDLA